MTSTEFINYLILNKYSFTVITDCVSPDFKVEVFKKDNKTKTDSYEIYDDTKLKPHTRSESNNDPIYRFFYEELKLQQTEAQNES